MPFRPVNDRHAIQEVAFALTFSRRFSHDEMEGFAKAHNRWQGELPKMDRDQVTVMVARPAAQVEVPARGTSFERYKADGSPVWRMRASDNWLAVNCLAYTGWADVWSHARQLLHQGAEVISAEDNRIGALALQYIDVFVWEGDTTQYDLGELLRKDSEFIPESIWGKGPFWHLHQGWFRADGIPEGGARLLERMHLDALPQGDTPVVKFDNTLRLDLLEGVTFPDLFAGEDALVDRVFEQLHEGNKLALAGYLGESMRERIGLNV